MMGVQRICDLSCDVVFCKVTNVSRLNVKGKEALSILTLEILNDVLDQNDCSHKSSGKYYDIAFAPITSPLVGTDAFLILKTHYFTSLRRPWLVVNAQVKRLFANAMGPPLWYEGRYLCHVTTSFVSYTI